MSSLRTDLSTFEWRVATGRWRWLLLGSLGVAGACGGKTDELPLAAKFHACEDPEAIDGGWERCANGLVHRPVVGQCSSQLPRAQGIDPAVLQRVYPNYVPGSGVGGSPGVDRPFCERDSDCTGAAHGYCEQGGYEPWAVVGACAYGCVVDSDCNEGFACQCDGGPIGSCVQSLCTTDADCAGGALCAKVETAPGCSQLVLACQTPRDTCATREDCSESQECAMDAYAASSTWRCAERMCVIGRPFLIDGQVCLAPVRQRSDWQSALPQLESSPDPALDAELRAAVSAGWLDQALMEHASVAAFARFSLQLLSLGAPAELVSAAAQAQADEIAHARDCFALARQHGAGDVGPGPLALGGALNETELSEIVLGTILEGCIGETVAALEAAEACSHCVDPTARVVLKRIAEDETRHAQLAWRFVAWALETGPESLQGLVREAFARELAGESLGPPRSSELEVRLLQHGLMSAELRAALRARVLREVIAPSAEALLAGARSAGAPEQVVCPPANLLRSGAA